MSSITSFRQSGKRQRQLSKLIRFIIAIFMILFALFPVLWTISASLDSTGSLATQKLIPDNASLDNYRTLLNSTTFPYKTWLWNSLRVATVVTILSVLITTMTAYAFSRFRFSGRESMLKSILLIQVFPATLAMVALFALVQQLGTFIPALGLNTLSGLSFIYLGGAMGINIWLMKGFFDTVPKEIDESAMVDGATHWQIFWRLLFPLVRPVVIVVGLLTFIGVYGDFILARILLKSTPKLTVMVGLYIFQDNQFSQNWGVFTAGAVMAAVPIVILYLLLQDYIAGGLTAGSVKG
ncbi:MAG: sugar ABC transporter permease [Anaerolineae bacterium]|nr:sugar ABC transporter permease [Anaerolineae bacterium]MCO5188614.1 sugar ABC transporter permease [Anaerolineae bacterium]MCO5193467.1 sugar ABC transporter permease [Anaerolineae bacterium]MCO5197419.1 sugar ABC transporter permease [Anaerolineae bacterium]MCO5204949.1 sugar ABC transporter permease [Anaerolineae bacterium]